MTEAGWTHVANVKAEGWYWWRRSVGYHKALKVYSVAESLCVAQGDDHLPVEEIDGGEWLGPITPDSFQQGQEAALDEVERYMVMRLRLAEASLATEILARNKVKQGRERAAIAELHGMQRHVSDIKEYIAQQAQNGRGDSYEV